MSNEAGLSFASTVNDHDDNLPKGRGDCFDYGSWYGCDCNCPQFCRGECTTVDENPEVFKQMIKKDEFADLEEIYEMYPQLKEI